MLSPMVELQMAAGMDSFVAPLVVVILSALTIYAYRYPNGYPAAAVILCLLLMVTAIGLLVWNFGVSVASRGILDFLPFEHHDQVQAIEDDLYMPANILLGILVTFVYVCLLLWFPAIGFTASRRKDERDE